MRRTLFALFLLASPPLLAAADFYSPIEVFPPAPDSHTGITIRFYANGCAPIPHATVSGKTVKLTSQNQGPCLPEVLPAQTRINIGTLAAGVYDIETELGYHAPLVVRDADAPFTVSPVGAPSTGGQPVQI